MEKRELQLNGRTYQLLLPAVTVAVPLSTRAITVFGPVAGLFADLRSLVDPDAPQEQRLSAVLARLGSVIAQLDPTASNALMMDAVNACGLCCDGQPVTGLNFERHFSQCRAEVFQVIIWCLWETVSPFLPASLTSIPRAMMSEAGAAFKSQTAGQTTTG